MCVRENGREREGVGEEGSVGEYKRRSSLEVRTTSEQ